MIKPILLIITILAFSSCSNNGDDQNASSIEDKTKRNQNWCWFEDSDTGEAKWIKVNGNGNLVKNGKYTLFYSNGAIRERGTKRNGNRADTTYYYSPNKFELIKYNFRIDDTDTVEAIYPNNGPFKLYYADFKLAEEGMVNNNRRTGIWKGYFKSGKLNFISGYKNGDPHGVYKVWNQSSILTEHSYWKNGKQDSLTLLFHANGKIKERSYWKNGKATGVYLDYYDNGQLKNKLDKYFDGILTGFGVKWFESGRKMYTIEYKNGKKNGSFVHYYDNGNIEQRGQAVDDIPIGKISFYDEKGKIYQVDTYVDGEIVDIKEY